MPKLKIIPVIMSGGAGTRLWPASRAAAPKQLLPLVTQRTMMQETADRLRGETDRFVFADPVIICNAAHGKTIKDQMQNIGINDPTVIIEPVGRNTAPCAAIAALAVHKLDPDALMLLAPADHHIRDTQAFLSAVSDALPAASSGHLVTFGITANGPETGYGYIQKGEKLNGHAYKVAAFKEKPDKQTAQTYLASGGYVWNAGIFLSSPTALLAEMKIHCPEIVTACESAFQNGKLDEKAFAACPAQSIDYALMEKTDKAAMVEADIGWSDIGSWAALWDMAKDENGNVLSGDYHAIDTKNSLVQSDGTFIATIGVENLAIIVKDGAVLVAKMDRVQDVKKVVEELKARGDHKRL